MSNHVRLQGSRRGNTPHAASSRIVPAGARSMLKLWDLTPYLPASASR
jgi:hypothetical protein